jgi:predicted nucleic acid-binding protein
MSDESGYQFVDTKVVVYAHDIDAGEKHERANDLIQQLWDTRRGCLSIQVLQEFYVTITRKVAQPLPVSVAVQHVADLGNWNLHTPNVNDILAAIELHHRYQISFWDALIVRSASQLHCKLIWSEDLNPGQSYAGVKILNPFAGSL